MPKHRSAGQRCRVIIAVVRRALGCHNARHRMIKNIQVIGYRCLSYIDVQIPQLALLVGPNASGKSTFLDVIYFLRDLLDWGAEDAIAERGQDFEDLTWMREGQPLQIAMDLELPEGLSTAAQPWCRYALTIGRDGEGRPGVLEESLWLRPARDEDAARSPRTLFPVDQLAPTNLMGKPYGSKWKVVVRKVPESGNDYFRSETSGWNTQFRIGPKRASLSNIPDDESKFPAALWLRDFLSEGVQKLELDSFAMKEPVSPRSPRRFEPDGSNLPVVVANLRKRNPERLREWEKHVRTILPDVAEITTARREVDRYEYLVLKYRSGLTAPAWLISDGTLRLLALTLLAYTENADRLYLIEEPENGLHPMAVEPVYQSLASVYDGQVLVASHNVLFVGLARPEDVLVFARTARGATDIVRGSDHPALLEWQGEVDLGTLLASGVLD